MWSGHVWSRFRSEHFNISYHSYLHKRSEKQYKVAGEASLLQVKAKVKGCQSYTKKVVTILCQPHAASMCMWEGQKIKGVPLQCLHVL